MNMKGNHTRLGAAVLAAALSTAPGMADSLTFYPTDDSMIRMASPEHTYGSWDRMQVTNRYGHPSQPAHFEQDALVRFDLSSIEPGAAILSATLRLY